MFKVKCMETVCTCDFTVGKVYEVSNGRLYDEDGFAWDNDGIEFTNVESINKYFSPLDIFHTKFKEVK